MPSLLPWLLITKTKSNTVWGTTLGCEYQQGGSWSWLPSYVLLILSTIPSRHSVESSSRLLYQIIWKFPFPRRVLPPLTHCASLCRGSQGWLHSYHLAPASWKFPLPLSWVGTLVSWILCLPCSWFTHLSWWSTFFCRFLGKHYMGSKIYETLYV